MKNLVVVTTSLPARLEAASRAIAACTDMSEIKQMNDQAAALVAAAATIKSAPELVVMARRVKNEALLRLGELLLAYDGTKVGIKGRKGGSTSSPRGDIIRAHKINHWIAISATRLAAGGELVRKKVLAARTSNHQKLQYLAPARGVGPASYASDIAREVMGAGLSLALAHLRRVATRPLRSMDPRDKPRVRKAVVEAQELLDQISQALE